MGASGGSLIALALVATAVACASPSPVASTPKSYVPWQPLPAAHHYMNPAQELPAAPLVPGGTPPCNATQMEGAGLAGGAAAGSVNRPLLLRNKGVSDCLVQGFADVTVLDRTGRVLAQAVGATGTGTFISDGPADPVLMVHGTPALPAPFQNRDGSEGQAFMNFFWYDCRHPLSSTLAIGLPDGEGTFRIPYATEAAGNPMCTSNYKAIARGLLSPAGNQWPYVEVEASVKAPAQARPGTRIIYYVTLRNAGNRDYAMRPCPDYSEGFYREQSCLVAVGAENVGEARRDDRLEAEVAKRPRRVLARRAAAEVGPGDQHRRTLVLGLVEHEVAARAPVIKEEGPVARPLDPLQELLGDDLIGVDVRQVERRHAPRHAPNGLQLEEFPHVDQVAGDRRRRGHRRRHQVRAPARALPALEVAVRGRGAPFAWRQDVRVHPEAHRAAGVAPLEARCLEHRVQPLLLGRVLHRRRARDDHRAHLGVNAPAVDHARRGPQVLQPRIRARADKHTVDRNIGQRHARLQVHVAERPLVGLGVRDGHPTGHRHHLRGRGAPRDVRLQCVGVDVDLAVE